MLQAADHRNHFNRRLTSLFLFSLNIKKSYSNPDSLVRLVFYKWLLFCPIVVFLLACNGSRQDQQLPSENDSLKNHLISANKIMVDNESSRIAEFIGRHKWKMDSTGS